MRLQTTLIHPEILIMGLSLEEMETVLCALCFFRSSPNLRKLEIWASGIQKASTNAFLQLLESNSKDFSLNHLERIELRNFASTRAEVEFVKFLLAKSSALKLRSCHV